MTEAETVASRKNAAIDRLTERFARNELPMDEYERLVADISRASSLSELAVVEEIVAGREGPLASRDPESGFISQALVQSCSAILSERNYRGNWLHKPNVAAATILASQIFDFTATALPPGPTTLEAFTVLGSVVILVPAGLSVRMEAVPVLGSALIGRGVETDERPGKPLLVVTGNAIFGSIEVKRR